MEFNMKKIASILAALVLVSGVALANDTSKAPVVTAKVEAPATKTATKHVVKKHKVVKVKKVTKAHKAVKPVMSVTKK